MLGNLLVSYWFQLESTCQLLCPFFFFVDPPAGYFRVDFIEKVLSKYSGKYSFRCGLSQEDILCYRLPDDPETMFATRDSVAEAPQAQFRIFPENPLGMGFYIACIDNGKFLCSILRCSVDMPHENGSFNIFNWRVHVHVYQIAIEVYTTLYLL